MAPEAVWFALTICMCLLAVASSRLLIEVESHLPPPPPPESVADIPDPLVEEFDALEREVRARKVAEVCGHMGHDWIDINSTMHAPGCFRRLCLRCGKTEDK